MSIPRQEVLLVSEMKEIHSHLGTERSTRDTLEIGRVVAVKGNRIARALELVDSNFTRTLKPVGNPDRVNTTIEERLGLFEKSTSENCERKAYRYVSFVPRQVIAAK
jgi:hypothetical protein